VNLRLAAGLVAVIILLLILGPEGTAHVITGVGGWIGKFVNAL
jgi:Sec-independent protein translocase protein TatA